MLVLSDARSFAMLCLLVTMYWKLVGADELQRGLNNRTTEYSTVVSSSVDPWSPVIGDTEGVPAITDRATTIPNISNGRRAVFSLVDNIRKQLMRDNYDYTINDSVERSTPKISQVTTTAGTIPIKEAFIRMNATAPSTSTIRYYRAVNMEPPVVTTLKPFKIQMQVASVSMPAKSSSRTLQRLHDFPGTHFIRTQYMAPPNKVATRHKKVSSSSSPKNNNSGKVFRYFDDTMNRGIMRVKTGYSKMFRSFDDSQNLRAHDVPIPATKMQKNAESQIVVSKKDLLFYIDDDLLRRKNAKGMMLRRQKYENIPENYIFNEISGTEAYQSDNAYTNQKIDQPSKYYEFDRDGRRNNQLLNTTNFCLKNHTQHNEVGPIHPTVPINELQPVNQHDNTKDTQMIQNSIINKGGRKKNMEPRTTKVESESSLYSDETEEEQNVENVKEENTLCSQCGKETIVAKSSKINNQHHTVHNLQHEVTKSNSINNNNTNALCLPRDEKPALQSPVINQNFRRMSRMRKANMKKHKRINLVGIKNVDQKNSKKKVDANAHTRSPRAKKVKRQRNQRQRQNNLKLKYKRNKKVQRLKKTTLINKNHNHENKVLNVSPNKNLEGGRSRKNKNLRRHRKVRPNHRGHKKNDQHVDDDVLNSQQVDKKKVVESKNVPDTEEEHHSHSAHISNEEVKKKHDYPDPNNNILNEDPGTDEISKNLQDNIPDDELNNSQSKPSQDIHNKSQQVQNDKIEDIDSMDNEDLTELYGRRMLNYKSSRQVDKSDDNLTDTHQYIKPNGSQVDTHNLKGEISSSVKYKLIKVPAVGGSRRSIKGHRQIVQERDANGVVLYAPDDKPFPQFRLPRDRRQYMDERVDKRSPLEHLSKISLKSRRSAHRKNRKKIAKNT